MQWANMTPLPFTLTCPATGFLTITSFCLGFSLSNLLECRISTLFCRSFVSLNNTRGTTLLICLYRTWESKWLLYTVCHLICFNDVQSCFLRTFLDRSSISKILHHISFLLVNLGFTMPIKLYWNKKLR